MTNIAVEIKSKANNKSGKAWIARILGLDEKFRLERQFLDVESNGYTSPKHHEVSVTVTAAGVYQEADAADMLLVVCDDGTWTRIAAKHAREVLSRSFGSESEVDALADSLKVR